MRRHRDPIARLDRRFVSQLLVYHNMSQMDLAERVGVHATLVPKYLAGTRPVPYPIACKIAEALGVQVWSICEGPLCPNCKQHVGDNWGDEPAQEAEVEAP